ncbi:MAG: outer membrane beta-barrel protein [Flavobacteriaceae bacterium]
MRKLISIILIVAWVSNTTAQKSKHQNSKKVKKDTWTIDVDFGATKLSEDEPTYSLLKDNVNVGFNVGATRTFENNLFVSAGVTFSVLKNGPFDLWENPMDYFSVNADVGYKFKSDALTEPYLAIGTSFISAVNTIPNAESSFSINFTGGFIFWLRDSNYGIVIQNTYKSVSSDYMVSHNRVTLGVRYRL